MNLVTVRRISAGTRQLFQTRLKIKVQGRPIPAIFVLVPGNYLRPGHCLQSPCYHRDFERVALFTYVINLHWDVAITQPMLVALWDHHTFVRITEFALCLFTSSVMLATLSYCAGIRACSLRSLQLTVWPFYGRLHCTWYVHTYIISGAYSILWQFRRVVSHSSCLTQGLPLHQAFDMHFRTSIHITLGT
jgi:hypothetical protein